MPARVQVRRASVRRLVTATVITAVVATGVVATGFTGATAAAGTSFSKPVRVTPAGCHDSQVVWTAGIARGFVRCGAGMFYVQGDGTKTFLRRTATTRRVREIFDVADDGGATYVLYVGGGEVRLLTRTRGGLVKDQVLNPLDSGGGDRWGSLVASKGKWWAVWTQPGGGLWQAHTMGAITAARFTLTHTRGGVYYPDLTVLSSTTVGMVWVTGHTNGCSTIEWGQSSGANTWTRSSSLHACGTQPVVSHAGGVWRVAWLQQFSATAYNVTYADHASGRWVKHPFTPRQSSLDPSPQTLSLAVSGSTVALAYTTEEPGGASRAIVDIRRGGRWTSTLLVAASHKGAVETRTGAVGLSGPKGARAQLLLTDVDDHFDVVRRD
jgi:hypothetical protein